MRKYVVAIAAAAMLLVSTAWSADDAFIIKTTTKSVEDVVKTIKAYTKKMKWVYIGENKIKKKTVVIIKFCVKKAGKMAFKAGLKISALVPCGNVGVYKNKKGLTEISMLHPKYMNVVYPNKHLEAAGKIVTPMFIKMMDEIVK